MRENHEGRELGENGSKDKLVEKHLKLEKYEKYVSKVLN